MKRKIVLGVLLFFSIFSLALVYYKPLVIERIRNNLAGIFFIESITPEGLKNTYALAKENKGKLKILVVPGHDNENWGTDFSGIKEADLNLLAGEELFKLLSQEKEFEIKLLRNRQGYDANFLSYLDKEKRSIKKFYQSRKQITDKLMESGLVKEREGVYHNKAPQDVGFRLYAINKWAGQ